MRRLALNLLMILALAVSLSPAAFAPPQVTAATTQTSTAAQAAPFSPAGRGAPPHLEPVPDEILALFADGMSAEEFVAMAGYVPRALEGIVEGDALMIIEMEADPVAVRYAARRGTPAPMSVDAVQDIIATLEAAQAQLEPRLAGLGVEVISNYTVVYNGFQALVPLDQLNAIRALPGVKALHRAPIHEPALGASVDLIGASQVRQSLGYDGTGITIAIIDTGIDYTHAAFGGLGNPLAYSLNDPTIIEPNTFPTDKVIAGWDFAGTLYHAGCPAADEAAGICTRIPNPDPDPLDEHGHGTHVASIAAGLAVGDVMTGTAPGATLMALKVFGQDGSTALTMNALEWATLQYLYTGKPEVVNMSLGANFGTADETDPSVFATNNAADVGIVVVASAGNAGNHAYITGSPATADRAISVAASTTGYVTGPTINVVDTDYITQTDIVYFPSAFDAGGDFDEQVVAPLGYVGNLEGAEDNELCTTAGIADDALEGHVALIQRGTCPFTVKVNNAASLGAVAAIIFNNAPGPITMGGDPVVIPAGSIQQQDGLNLVPADGETVVISAQDEVVTVPDPYTPADSIATFTSRGPRGTDSFLKPDITAPGVGIFAAHFSTGVSGVSMGGTSMAAPHIAGVAALMVQANPNWTPEEVKAVMMNTAVDLADETPIPLSGAGRVDAYRAVRSEVTAIGDEHLVGLNYGVIFSRNDTVTRVKNVAVTNHSGRAQTYDVGWAFQEGSRTLGADMTVEPSRIRIDAGETAIVTVTLTLDFTVIPVEFRSVEEYFGFITFDHDLHVMYLPIVLQTADVEADGSVGFAAASMVAGRLRVPFYFQPRPYSQLEVESEGVIEDPVTDSVMITMTHQGPITSSTYMLPALVWNDTPDPDMTGPADVRLFGMDYGWTQPGIGDIIEVAINAWDYWHVPQPFFAEFNLYIDANQDGIDDFVNFNFNFGAVFGTGHDNTWVVIQIDLADGTVDLASPWIIYTDYNASYMEWWLPAAWQGLGPEDSTFDYQLLGFDEEGVSETPRGQFDYARSPFMWSISHDPGPADPEATAEVMIDDLDGYLYSEPEGVMLIDYRGDPRNVNGGQAYFIPIEVDLMD